MFLATRTLPGSPPDPRIRKVRPAELLTREIDRRAIVRLPRLQPRFLPSRARSSYGSANW